MSAALLSHPTRPQPKLSVRASSLVVVHRAGRRRDPQRYPPALVFPDPVAAPVEPDDPTVGEPVGDLRAPIIARGTRDRPDRGISIDVPRRSTGPPRCGQWRYDARQDPGGHPLTDRLGDVLSVHVWLHLHVEDSRSKTPFRKTLRQTSSSPGAACRRRHPRAPRHRDHAGASSDLRRGRSLR